MKMMVALVITILILFMTNLFWPLDKTRVGDVSIKKTVVEETAIAGVASADEVDLSVELNKPSDDEKVKRMTAAYALLEDERKELKRRLSRLKHDIWGLKFEPEKAKKMSDIMLEAHKLIRNPEMLGAFLNAKEIEDETAKIRFAGKSLNQIDEMVGEKKLQKAQLN